MNEKIKSQNIVQILPTQLAFCWEMKIITNDKCKIDHNQQPEKSQNPDSEIYPSAGERVILHEATHNFGKT